MANTMTDAEVLDVKVFQPMYHPNGTVTPARAEVIVRNYSGQHSWLRCEDGWLVAEYDGTFYLFWHEGDLAEKDGQPYEGVFNCLNWVHLLMPVTVRDDTSGKTYEMFATSSFLQPWLDKLGWELRAQSTTELNDVVLCLAEQG